MSENKFDVIVIGAGPAGYVCAIRAAQLGLNVACIEVRKTLGGTCLNVGCIPSKALLQSSHLYELAKSGLDSHGIKVKDVSVDLGAMMKRKDTVVADLTKGIDYLFKKNKITHIEGKAQILKNKQVKVADKTFSADHIVIATGSETTLLPGIAVDEKRVVTSTGALELDRIPDHLVVIGAGFIGLEIGSVWLRLGSKVTVVEFLDRIVPAMDQEVAKALKKSLEKQGMVFKLMTKVAGVQQTNKNLSVALESRDNDSKETIDCDVLLVAAGRRPYTEDLGLAEAGIKVDARGIVEVDDYFRTSQPGVYAIGDVIRGPMLAHKSEDEGIAVAEIIAGKSGHVNYNAIPGIVYTHPEVASVGKTEEELKASGIEYNIGKFPFSANARAKSSGDIEGFVKILADKNTDRILGAHIIGPEAGSLIAEIVLGLEYWASSEDIARTCHAHPTLNEAVKEAALAADGRVIHI